jgi:hypothetical protein
MKYACLLLIGLVLGLFSASASSACTNPPRTSIGISWPAGAVVTVNYNSSTILSATQSVVTSWNAALAGSLGSYATACNPPQFTFGSGNASIHLIYGTIPTNLLPAAGSDTISTSTTVSVSRGLTDFPNATWTTTTPRRLSAINIYINSGVNATAALTEVIAHEFGHTLGITDCMAPSPCAFHSSVMNSQQPNTAPVSGGLNGLIGMPGPTICDIAQIGIVVYDYNCADSPPGTQDCTPCYYGASLHGTGKPKLLPVQVPGQCCSVSPVVVDVSGKGFVLTDAPDGVKFDIAGTGNFVQMAWTAPGANNAFLALPGPDGLVHNGKQLFGNFTPQPPGTYNGFAALAVYDQPSRGGNGDGVIDNKDAIFSSLRLWVDANHDGISQPEELHTLPSMGVNSISLKYHLERRTDQYGNVFRYAAQVNPNDPSSVGKIAYDIFFVVLNPDGSVQTKCVPPPELWKDGKTK